MTSLSNAAWKSTVAAAAHITATHFCTALRLALAVAADEGPVTDTEEKHFISAPFDEGRTKTSRVRVFETLHKTGVDNWTEREQFLSDNIVFASL